jgi:hypothetical protein
MKKLRLTIRIITAGLIILTIVGIVILVLNEKLNLLDTSYEIIAFTIGAAGMIMAVTSQIDSYQDEKRFKRMMTEIEQLNREHDADDRVDAAFQKRLDALLQTDHEIYKRLTAKTARTGSRK